MTSAQRHTVPASGVAAGYPGHHLSTPQLLPQLMEAATNCVDTFCRVERGERVLVVAEPDSDPLVVSSFAAAATLAGADVATITVPPFSAGGFVRGQPGDLLLGAVEHADVVIACTYFEYAHCERTFFSRIFGSSRRVCSVLMGASPGCLVTAGRFPMDLYMEIARRALRLMQGCKRIRYVTDSGTDITFEGPQGIGCSEPLKPGTWSIFPPMGINFYPDNSHGDIVFDESTLTGRPLAPVRIRIDDNFVSGVEAGAAADAAVIDAFANGRYYMRHAVVGLNPKIRMINAPQFERERAAGTAYLGIDGTGAAGAIDRSQPGFAHLDMIFDTPTVYVDDVLMVDRRRLLLLDDPELHEYARRHGEPRRILAQNPFIW
ncbi:MAG: hypothetical protein IT495_10500 [Gammaproteobacteria bacterium]|nr:hypothetical protein [Gammaproteobacteria bacterium]